MNVGKWIVIAFVLFAAFIMSMVMICMKQDINLVSKEYYQNELHYQTKLDRINNANRLAHLPTVAIEDGYIKISFGGNPVLQKGELKIERPSNDKLDRGFSLIPEKSYQEFYLGKWEPGLYRASVTWTMDGKDFYYEKQIIL